jgi:N-acetylmuramoyl-L-alanine amidase
MKNIRKLVSPNFNDRAGGIQPTILILHYTGTSTGQEAEDYYMNTKTDPKAGPISPHYMIERDGSVTQFVEEGKRAFHAGKSWWNGETDINSHSIGIELVNPGHDKGYLDFTPEQMESLSKLVKDILTRNDIPPHRILGHSDVFPHVTVDRIKPDPGEKLNWAWLASEGIGLWPQPDKDDYDMAAVLYADPVSLRQAFTEYGYDPNGSDHDVIAAFQRHFQPEAYAQKRQGLADDDTAARLHWLLKAKNAYNP